MEKENLELATQLAKKEAELDVKTQEKEDVEANLERTKVPFKYYVSKQGGWVRVDANFCLRRH